MSVTLYFINHEPLNKCVPRKVKKQMNKKKTQKTTPKKYRQKKQTKMQPKNTCFQKGSKLNSAIKLFYTFMEKLRMCCAQKGIEKMASCEVADVPH